jgi:hypothetical protein
MKYLLTMLIISTLACSKSTTNNMVASDMATIDSVWASRLSQTQYSIEFDLTVKNDAMTTLELYRSPGFFIGKIDNPKSGHYTFTVDLLGVFQFNMLTSGRRFELPVFHLQ